MTTPTTVRDLIIVGSGPAGYTAGVYAARAELEPLLFEGTQFGGSLMTTTEVEKFPGSGRASWAPDLMGRDARAGQAFRRGHPHRGRRGDRAGRAGQEVVANGETYYARAVILAMGAAARYLGIPGEERLLGPRCECLRHL